MEYLLFGETLVDEHINSNNSPFKYNGKEFDEETGNYYYGARYYDPKLSIFISVDPLVEKTTDAYGYCYQNPIRYIDPDGMDPTPFEAALMASHVYSNSGYLAGGWQQSYIYQYNVNGDNSTGLKGAMYERIKEDGVREYAYVFAGTEDIEKDGLNDLTQVLSHSEQYDIAAALAAGMSQYIGNQDLVFIGHSLGGGLANYASLATGRSSITFNPAWLSVRSKKKLSNIIELNKKRYRINYVHESDPLHKMQTTYGRSIIEPTGENVMVNGGFFSNIFSGHLIGTMISRMNSNNMNEVHTGNRDDKLIHVSPRDL